MIEETVSATDIAMPPTGDIVIDILMGVAVVLVFAMGMMAAVSYGAQDVYWWFRDRVVDGVHRFRMYRR